MFLFAVFKVAVIVVFLFCGWFTDNFVIVFVICVLLSSADFYVVKNFSGRSASIFSFRSLFFSLYSRF